MLKSGLNMCEKEILHSVSDILDGEWHQKSEIPGFCRRTLYFHIFQVFGRKRQ